MVGNLPYGGPISRSGRLSPTVAKKNEKWGWKRKKGKETGKEREETGRDTNWRKRTLLRPDGRHLKPYCTESRVYAVGQPQEEGRRWRKKK